MAKRARAVPVDFGPRRGYAVIPDHPEVSMVTGVDFLGKQAPVDMGKTPISGWNSEYAAHERAAELRQRGGIKS